MQYMLMCCFDEKARTELPDDEKLRIMREYGALIQSLAEYGQLRGGGQLRPTSSATTLRMKNGKPILTDGPFAETKEQLAATIWSTVRTWTNRSPSPNLFRRSRRGARLKCAPLSRSMTAISRQANERPNKRVPRCRYERANIIAPGGLSTAND